MSPLVILKLAQDALAELRRIRELLEQNSGSAR